MYAPKQPVHQEYPQEYAQELPADPPVEASLPSGHPEAMTVAGSRQWKVVTPRVRARRVVPRFWWWGLAAMVASTLLLYLHTVIKEASLNRIQNEIRQVKDANVRCRAVLARAESPMTIEETAKSRLAMTGPTQILFLAPAPAGQTGKISRRPMPVPPPVVHEGF